MITALLAEFWPYLLALLAAVGGVWGYGRSKGKQARDETYIEILRDRHQREERGRDAVSDLRSDDRGDLVERLRQNDGRW